MMNHILIPAAWLPLVEEADCKRRIEATGCAWSHHPYDDRPISVHPLTPLGGFPQFFTTWLAAAGWAEEHRQPECKAKAILTMTQDECLSELAALGATDLTETLWGLGALPEQVATAMYRTAVWEYARLKGRSDAEQDEVTAAPAEEPQQAPEPEEEWSEPVWQMSSEQCVEVLHQLGVDRIDFTWALYVQPWLRGFASANERMATDGTDRVRLSP